MAAGSDQETLGPLLNVLAQSLDVREVFARISALARHTVPHDCLLFGLVAEDGEHYRVVAVSEEEPRAALLEKSFAPPSPGLAHEEFAIFRNFRSLPGKTEGLEGLVRTASSGADERFEWRPGPPWVAMGYPSWLRLTVRLRGNVLGFLNFLSRAADPYREADVPAGRRIADLVALNCAALAEALLESELFGYEKGAFTGAVSARAGRLEQAGGGTLFLDEVGEMSPAVQAKLLRVLQEREFQRLGGTRTLKADVRVIAATNRDLQAAMTRGAFREDLYYRLHVFAIHLPPLRERQEDILPLLEHFVEELGPVVIGRPAAGISREARAHLLAHAWPGNVRELRNAEERALILCEGGLINPEHLPWHAESATSAPLPAVPAAPQAAVGDFPAHGVDLEAMERTLIEGALKQTGRNKSKAAKLLGLSRGKLYTRMERFGLS